MAIRDRRTLSLGQGGTKAKKAEVEQTSELVGRRRGEAERVFHAEKTTCDSHRKTSKASSRTTRKVRFHLRIMERKEASKKKSLGKHTLVSSERSDDGAGAKRRNMQHLNFGGNQNKLHRERVGRKESLYISF